MAASSGQAYMNLRYSSSRASKKNQISYELQDIANSNRMANAKLTEILQSPPIPIAIAGALVDAGAAVDVFVAPPISIPPISILSSKMGYRFSMF